MKAIESTGMPSHNSVSSYVLTHNGERYLDEILQRLRAFSDEVIIVDSGSRDGTHAIARRHDCRLVVREFVDFRVQREFATSLCSCDFVFFCDCDEVPSLELVKFIHEAKAKGFQSPRYRVRRDWRVQGRCVHAVFPVPSPDYPTRLVRRDLATYHFSPSVHERYDNCKDDVATVPYPLLHFTLDSDREFREKLIRYSRLAAADLRRKRRPTWFLVLKLLVSPAAAFLQWYLLKGGVLDGRMGLRLSHYAMRSKWWKYRWALCAP